MKNFLVFVCGLFCAVSVSAQDCKGYYYLLNNAEIEMSIYDAKGSVTGKSIYKITNVHKDGSGTTSDFANTFYDKNNKEISTGTGHFKCSGSGVSVDMKLSMPNMPQLKDMKMEAKTSQAFLDYPSNMHTGQDLQGGTFEMAGNMNGMDLALNYSVSNRKVTGNEKITTPAGSWDCFKISYDIDFKMTVMGAGMPVKLSAEEWFAPGFGVVKTISYNKGGKQVGSTVITGIKK
ncbi:hypothetical protein CLV51_102107 [Chitinophaga niastensis]|uniref:DUF3108 domain-containing protein n=1 Tax=Chitinophaga niastensis TaxID=536980 RepID=A0A2P8HM18_CHINA|nr:hypothetical protein [Chitinophaga niastensis]PSL47262.1 hypothetical protein CLV51_102107 [Chitinophaga niastensis]